MRGGVYLPKNNIFKSFDDENINNVINNDKEIKEILNSDSAKKLANNEDFRQFKEKYKDKSDDEILKDAKAYSDKLKSQLGEEEYNKKLQELKKFEMFLSKDQKNKLNDFLNKIK